MSAFLNKIDKFICYYLGLSGDEVDRMKTIKFINNNIIIYKNSPYQRHKSSESLKNFSENSINKIDHVSKQKIGLAAGKAIAKHLTISFDEVKIKKCL